MAIGSTNAPGRGSSYVHPTHTAYASGFYLVQVDTLGHVVGAVPVQKSDITALGIPAQDTTYGAASASAAGLMSSTHFSKLEGIEAEANKTTVDSTMSSSSTNPVQNKVVEARIAGVENMLGGITFSIVDGALVVTYPDE